MRIHITSRLFYHIPVRGAIAFAVRTVFFGGTAHVQTPCRRNTPHSLDDVVGQKHILGERGLLRRIVESGSIPNMIFYGPSGTGKTTVARIIAEKTNRTLRKLNATTAGLADIKDHRRA